MGEKNPQQNLVLHFTKPKIQSEVVYILNLLKMVGPYIFYILHIFTYYIIHIPHVLKYSSKIP